jgi:short-subunit dehydrogenase
VRSATQFHDEGAIVKTFENKTAFLTGAASGIGRELAFQLSMLGCNLYLVDIDEGGLNDVARVTGQRVQVRTRVCDLADSSAISSTLCDFDRNADVIDLLINNAGVAYYGQTHAMTQQQWDWLMAINLLAPIRITNHFLPRLMERPDAHIANMCSISGMVAGGRFAAYHTSKFGLIGFTEALRAEYGRKGIGVTAVCPGPVQTNLYEAAAAAENGRVPTPPCFLCASATRVAALTIRAIRRNKRQVVITPMAHGLYQLKRFAPGLIDFANQFSRKKKRRLADLQQKELERLASKADSDEVNLRRVA